MDWVTFFSGFGLAALLGILVNIWLGTRIKHDYDKKLEDYKQEKKTQAQEAEDEKKADKQLMQALLSDLPSHYVDKTLKENDFGYSFEWQMVVPLELFIDSWVDVGHEFQDEKLEEKKTELISSIKEFFRATNDAQVSIKDGTHLYEIPREWGNGKQNEDFSESRQKINDAADRVVSAYDDLVSTGRRKLKL